MTNQSASPQRRDFKMHASLLYTVMKSQAGTLSKAILEPCQNSVDAGAKSIHITLDNTSFSISDDGKGIQSMQDINDFFDTFGTPHAKGDAKFGRFRIGRGQCFSFGVNVWKTNSFQMNVDIKNDPDGYHLSSLDVPRKGCSIECDLYDPLSPFDYIDTVRTIKEMCKYTPADVYLNGDLISINPDHEKWSIVNDDAYILANNTKTLAVYNQGILVGKLPATKFGAGGVIVSKKQLEVNFARNEILYSQCEVWKAVKPVFTKLADQINGGEKGVRITEEWRTKKATELQTEMSHKNWREMERHPVFTDISGKHYSLSNLENRKFVLGNKGCRKSDYINTIKKAVVLNQELLKSRFEARDDAHLEEILMALFQNALRSTRSFWHDFSKEKNPWIENMMSLDVMSQEFSTDHLVLTNKKDISSVVALALRILNGVSENVAWMVNYHTGRSCAKRVIGAMRSDTADAITDGHTTIYINIKYLKGYAGPFEGIAWASRVAGLLVHEYLHDVNSGLGHDHDHEFYESYHNLVLGDQHGGIIRSIFNNMVKLCMDEAHKISASQGQDAGNEVRLSGILAKSDFLSQQDN